MITYYSRTLLFLILGVFITEKSYSSASVKGNNKPFVVIIDAGHGGKDPGAVSKGIREKDVVLAIALKLGKHISENFPEVKVIFTRNTDVFVPLIDRSKIANRNKADLFISLHANFCGTPSTRGTETFFLGDARSNDNLDVAKKENSVILLEDNYATTYEGFDPNSSESYIMFSMAQENYLAQSLSLADDIQHQFKSRLESSNRGVKQAGFLVLRQSSMPSVLIETGFISNPADADYLSSNEGQQTIAQSVFEAFKRFKSRNSGSGTPALAETKTVAAEQKNIVTNKNDAGNSTKDTGNYKNEKPVQPIVVTKPESTITTNKQEVIPEKTADVKVEISKDKKPTADQKLNKETEKHKVDTEKINPVADIVANQKNETKYYSVQIGANTIPLEPTPANFKGIVEVRREKSDKYYRYFIGKELSVESIIPIWKKIRLKFPQSFVVSFEDGKRTILDHLSN